MCLSMPPASTSSENSAGGDTGSVPSTSRPPAPSSPTSAAQDETEAGGDEVKVFNDEDEREANPQEKIQQVDILSAIKSSLITDTEQGKSDPRHAFAGHEKFYDPALLMAPYLMNSYAAAAYAANGLTNGSLMRSSFLYGDPLPSPPPAHLAASHPGLRPPLGYPLPPTPQYPYSMLGADQLAAWHHQAAIYQQNALRAASPYSLPITSSSLPSPMSHFSPGGLLGAHPGLSPGLGHHPGRHLPHHIKPEPGYDRKHSEGKDSSPSKSKKDHIKKPLNAFMLYMKEMRPIVQAECTLKESAAINQILGRRWHSLTREDQAKYYEKARLERQKHLQMYPHWNARDNYRYGLKKKKRKRDKTDDPAASMKKCRARYGLDQQELWCRPCRRKKKCIRVNNLRDSENGGGATNHTLGGNPSNENSRQNSQNDKFINNNVTENSKNRLMHSDDEDGSGSDLDDDDSPPSHQGRNSVESTSEQSLTSPAGFSSLPSIGSPSGSIASPATPGGYENIPSSGPPGLMGAPDPSYWYSRPPGAFKPPPPTPASSIGGYNHAQHLQALHHYQQLGGLFQRPPVGTDPRDSKNPLSISQLTGNHCSSSTHHPSSSGVPNGPTGESKRTLLGIT